MESIIADEEWSSLNGIYAVTEESDFIAQLLGTYPLFNELSSTNGLNAGKTTVEENDSFVSFLTNSGNPTLLTCSSSNQLFDMNEHSHSHSHATNFVDNTDIGYSRLDFWIEDSTRDNITESNYDLHQKIVSNEALQVKVDHNPKKRSRSMGDLQKNTRNVKSKKNRKVNDISGTNDNNIDEDVNARLNTQSSSSYCTEEDDPIGLSEGTRAPLSSNGKTRASRGAATDPQSLYARKRRERINERLRILQNLVPNGTKVDISTMLEEAVEYVKFLQLQIKLLSSDEMWMYAPIAYNGMKLGLDLQLTLPR